MKLYPLFFHDTTLCHNNHKEKLIHTTTCVLLDENKNVTSIGFSFQNIKDGENRKIGNKLSKIRAIASFKANKNILPINRNNIKSLLRYEKCPDAKGIFNPSPYLYEKFSFLIKKKILNDKESIEA